MNDWVGSSVETSVGRIYEWRIDAPFMNLKSEAELSPQFTNGKIIAFVLLLFDIAESVHKDE
jgi:hypothetical protein